MATTCMMSRVRTRTHGSVGRRRLRPPLTRLEQRGIRDIGTTKAQFPKYKPKLSIGDDQSRIPQAPSRLVCHEERRKPFMLY